MKRFLVDTNVLVRFLTHDDPAKSPKADALFASAAAGEITLVLADVVIVETIWVLTSAYELPRSQVAQALVSVVTKPGIFCANERAILDALKFYNDTKLDIVDCCLAAQALQSADGLASFDEDFSKVAGLTRWEWGRKRC